MTAASILLELVRDPYRRLLLEWNWKSAFLSASMRASIFFATNLAAGFRAAAGAMLAEFVFRTAISGFYGAATQALRRAEPPWQGALAVMVVLPLCSHTLEFLLHYLRGTPKLWTSVAVSVAFTGVSTLFNWYAMRRGALLVGDGRQSLAEDMKSMPAIVAGFLLAGPRALGRAALRLL
ncbi:MAG TPA: hypothetical protein DEH78_06590 [Solibacterales bacterium]|nr:hypothetical protein [Bryobacterales bacterium]